MDTERALAVKREVRRAGRFEGTVQVPSDKSLTHRAVMFSALSDGKSVINRPLEAADCQSTASCVSQLGIEVVRAPGTSDETVSEIVELARDLGKTPAEVNDFPGFVSNRILMPLINEAVYALADGVAEPDAIDTIAKLGFNHPMGPLALADLIGLDTCVSIKDVLRDGLGDSKYEPCPLLREHVAAGRLGRKSGQGFYEYS